MSYCPICGSKVVLIENGDFYCATCDMYLAPNAVEDQPVPTMLSFMSGRENLPGEGCRACGNPVHPKCIDSCPLMED